MRVSEPPQPPNAHAPSTPPYRQAYACQPLLTSSLLLALLPHLLHRNMPPPLQLHAPHRLSPANAARVQSVFPTAARPPAAVPMRSDASARLLLLLLRRRSCGTPCLLLAISATSCAAVLSTAALFSCVAHLSSILAVATSSVYCVLDVA